MYKLLQPNASLRTGCHRPAGIGALLKTLAQRKGAVSSDRFPYAGGDLLACCGHIDRQLRDHSIGSGEL
jgi:hypothetical protein